MSGSWGRNLKALGIVCFAAASLAGLASCVFVVSGIAGTLAAWVAVLLAPLTFIAVPWYAGLVLGDWLPFTLNYGVGSVAVMLFAAGNWIQSAESSH